MSAVSEIMSSRKLVSVNEDSEPSVLHVTKLMLKNKIGSVVVVNRNNTPVGIVTERDVLRKVSKARRLPASMKAKEIMSSPVISIRPYDSVETAAAVMASKNVKRLVVVEQDGSIAGVISLTDITRKLAKILTDEQSRYSGLKSVFDR